MALWAITGLLKIWRLITFSIPGPACLLGASTERPLHHRRGIPLMGSAANIECMPDHPSISGRVWGSNAAPPPYQASLTSP